MSLQAQIAHKEQYLAELKATIGTLTPFKAACQYFGGKASLDEYLIGMEYFDEIKKTEEEITVLQLKLRTPA